MVKKIIQRVIVGVLVSIILTVIYGVVNANAIELTTDVELVRTIPVGTDLRCQIDWNRTIVTVNSNQYGECVVDTSQAPSDFPATGLPYVRNLFTNTTHDITEGNYYTFLIGYQNTLDFYDITWNISSPSNVYDVISWESVDESQKRDFCNSYKLVNNNEYSCYHPNYWASKYISVTLRAKITANTRIIIGSLNGQPRSLFVLGSAVNPGQLSMSNIIEWKPTKSSAEIMEEDKTENQQQGEQSQTDAESTNQQTEENTQNLLGFLTSFFGAFTSAQATNCNMDWGLSQYGFGVIDMCSTQIPATFSVILSIITLLMVLPMILWLINSIIKAFKEFQE